MGLPKRAGQGPKGQGTISPNESTLKKIIVFFANFCCKLQLESLWQKILNPQKIFLSKLFRQRLILLQKKDFFQVNRPCLSCSLIHVKGIFILMVACLPYISMYFWKHSIGSVILFTFHMKVFFKKGALTQPICFSVTIAVKYVT